jgi:hypothetical protein
MRAITVVVMAALLGGCGSTSKTVYEKAGVGDEQVRRDEAQCVQISLDTSGTRGAAYLSVDRDEVDRCMRARGYTVGTTTNR